jgi:serine/threonine protein kinase
VSYFGSFQDPDGKNMCIVMEFLPGGTLQDVVKEYGRYGGLEEDHMRNVIGSVLKGLAYLHKLNIMHRDMKSKNILIDADGGTKLADFGVSRELHQSCMARSMVGTPLFMAPEILEGDPYGYGADVWSLGIVSLHVANGEIPRRGTPVRELMRMVIAQPPPTIQCPEQWSKEFSHFISMCLVKSPEKRANCEDLLNSDWIRNCGDDSEQTKANMKGRTIGRANAFNDRSSRPMTPNKLMQPAVQATPVPASKEGTPVSTVPMRRAVPLANKVFQTPTQEVASQEGTPVSTIPLRRAIPVSQASKPQITPCNTPKNGHEQKQMDDLVKELMGWKQLALKLLDEREANQVNE